MLHPKRRSFRFSIPLLLAGLGLVCAAGCQSLPRSGLDPYGERLFESCPFQGLKLPECDLFKRSGTTSTPTPVPIAASPVPQPVPITSSDPASPTTGLLPGGLGAAQPAGSTVPQYGSTATAMDPRVRGVNTALIASPDAGPSPVFEDTGGYALPTEPIEGPALLMTPREQIAPVGSEVVMISSYLGKKDRLVTNEKIEWTLEGVGSIMKFDRGSCCDPLFFDYVRSKKVTDRYAITKTSQVYQHLDRGTPETKDDIHLLRGQSWISVNSMREGTTHVAAFAPSLKDWSKRTDVGIIHWVDAQWVLPQLPLAPVGESRVLTTTVLRRTNGQPRPGWIVRYELLNGPSGGFGSSLAQIEEVETDMSGQASIVMYQRDQQSGTNTIAVHIIRPAGVDGSDRRVTVGSETIRQSWTGSAGVRVRVQGPESSAIGKDTPYTITVSNSTASVAGGIVALTFPPTTSFVGANPSPVRQDPTLVQWNVSVPPNGVTSIQCTLRPGTAGRLIPEAKFYPQGVSVEPAGSIPTTSVPITSAAPSPAAPAPRPQDPAASTPVLPSTTSEKASVYQPGGSGSLPLAGTTPPNSGAALFRHNLDLKIVPLTDPAKSPVFQSGKSCLVAFRVHNKGNTSVPNVVLLLSLPPEYKDRTLKGLERVQAYGKLNSRTYNMEMPVSEIPAGETVELQMLLPTIDMQGYQFVGSVQSGGKEIGSIRQRIVPPR